MRILLITRLHSLLSSLAMAQRESVKVVEKFDLNQLIHAHIAESGTDESFFIVDVGDIVRKFILWYELMPRIDPDFAFKCNNHPSVVGTLAALGKAINHLKPNCQNTIDININRCRF